MTKRLTMDNGDVVDADRPFRGMLLECADCDRRTQPTRKADDPDSVVRCLACGMKHSTDSLRYVGGV